MAKLLRVNQLKEEDVVPHTMEVLKVWKRAMTTCPSNSSTPARILLLWCIPTVVGPQIPVSPVVKLYPTTESAYFVDSVLCSVRNIDCEGCFTCELLTRRDFPLLSIHRPHPIRNE